MTHDMGPGDTEIQGNYEKIVMGSLPGITEDLSDKTQNVILPTIIVLLLRRCTIDD